MPWPMRLGPPPRIMMRSLPVEGRVSSSSCQVPLRVAGVPACRSSASRYAGTPLRLDRGHRRFVGRVVVRRVGLELGGAGIDAACTRHRCRRLLRRRRTSHLGRCSRGWRAGGRRSRAAWPRSSSARRWPASQGRGHGIAQPQSSSSRRSRGCCCRNQRIDLACAGGSPRPSCPLLKA